LPFFHVDAFAHRPFTGNPAAVMPLDAWLDDATLQAIAEENNLAETAFTIPATGDADYELRWFTPTVEVALCGHATLASGHMLIGDRDIVRFRTRQSGILSVARDGDGYSLSLPTAKVAPKPLPEIVAALGGAEPIETLYNEGGYSLIRYADEAAVRALEPDFRALKPLGDFLFIVTAPGTETDIVSRAFAPGAGIDEDPVTGSAHAILTLYWAGQLGRDSFTAYQASARGGYVSCRLEGDRAVLGGLCRTVIEGRYAI
jgi:PhzF family phenazine biosynthesis protein